MDDVWLLATLWYFFAASFTALVAESKRRNGFGWLILGLLFGPIALLAAVGMAPGGKPCRSCCELIAPRASVCPHCGTEKPVPQVEKPNDFAGF